MKKEQHGPGVPLASLACAICMIDVIRTSLANADTEGVYLDALWGVQEYLSNLANQLEVCLLAEKSEVVVV